MVHPSVPSVLLDVELVGAFEDGVPQVITCTANEDAGVVLGAGCEQLADDAAGDAAALTSVGFTAGQGDTWVVSRGGANPDHAWLLGLGDGTERAWRSAGAALVWAANQRLEKVGAAGGTDLQIWLPEIVDPGQVRALVTGLIVGSHRLRISATEPKHRVTSVLLITTATYELRDALGEGRALGRATALARDLAGMPSDVKSPEWLADTAKAACVAVPGLEATIRDEDWLQDNGFGGVIA
ncbi:MAG: hypothetical protein ACXVXZ_14400, partial [Mycobacteriaceae bacterium]